ncbi:hypothetical protein ABH926_009705 [Catenulispora sp. GP43]|uniref:hypothetical protein n=1 Tax=Catenulispora sp. GP43 TaxID=3156263 RepID=UPI00351483EE
MNIKASVAAVVLAAATVGLSACASSASKAGAAGSGEAAGPASTTAASPATTSSSDPATPASPSNPAAPTRQTSAQPDIPDIAMLSLVDLAPSSTGAWKQYSNPAVAASQSVDPDNCDPVVRPQFVDPAYPRNPAWVKTRNMSWSAPSNSQVGETVITYATAAAASADFAKHRGWIAGCASRFQWTDAPATYSISNMAPNGVANSYGIRVAISAPGAPASAAGAQGIDYMAVILRGNSLTVVNVSGPSTSQDPGVSSVQHDVKVAAGKLATLYAGSR